MLKMVDGTGIIGVDMICPLGISTPQPPNYDRVEMEGTGMLVLPNSLDAPLERLELGGKTEQVQTTGKNLFDTKTYRDMNGCEIINNNQISFIQNLAKITYETKLDSGDYRISFKRKKYSSFTVRNGESVLNTNGGEIDYGYTIKLSEPAVISIEFASGQNPNAEQRIIYNIQLEKSSTTTPYEPYTGGKPSPSPEYPQAIKNVGKWNEEKQKYEVDVKVTGKNLFDREKAKDNSNWIIKSNDGYAKFPIYVKKGNKITFSYTEKLTTGKKFYLGISLSDAGSTVAWLYHDTTASLINNKYTIAATNDYIYLMCSKSDIQNFVDTIQTLQVEISPAQTDYQPYAEQSLTLTSDRPLTKWDRLVEQGGQIGWLYGSRIAEIPKTGYALKNTNENRYGVYFSKLNIFKDAVVTKGSPEKDSNIFTHFKPGNPYSSNGNTAWLYVAGGNTDLRIKVDDETINTVELFEQYISDKDIRIMYETAEPELIPLSPSEQNAIRALKTYYPTTVITVDGGELDPDIKVTYRKEI